MNESVCLRKGCGHKEKQHALASKRGPSSKCMACVGCNGYVEPVPVSYEIRWEPVDTPPKVSMTTDQIEGMKAELSFANSKVEELDLRLAQAQEKLARYEELRREMQQRTSNLARDNFDLMRQKAKVEAKLDSLVNELETRSWTDGLPVSVLAYAKLENRVEELEALLAEFQRKVKANDIEKIGTSWVPSVDIDVEEMLESDQERDSLAEESKDRLTQESIAEYGKSVFGEDDRWERLLQFGEEEE